jgi:hypothetical protein
LKSGTGCLRTKRCDMLIGQQEGKKLTNKQYGILVACLNTLGKGWQLHDADTEYIKSDIEGLVSLGLVTKENGPEENMITLKETQQGRNAVRDRPKRIILPSL